MVSQIVSEKSFGYFGDEFRRSVQGKRYKKPSKKRRKTRKPQNLGSEGPGTPPITPKTPIWPKPAIPTFARFRTCAYYSDLFLDFGGQKRGLLHLHFWGFWGGRRGGRGGWGVPGVTFGGWGHFSNQVLEIFPLVRILGIHPQNNQDKKNKVYITSTITRAIKLDTFRLYVIKTNGLKTFYFSHTNNLSL